MAISLVKYFNKLIKNRTSKILVNDGFTIVEIVITLSILSILSVVMFSVNQSVKEQVALTKKI